MESALRFTRFIPLGLSLLLAVGAGFALPGCWAVILLLAGAGLALIGFYDLRQPFPSVRRNFRIVGRLRWLFVEIRPGLSKYRFADEHATPTFSTTRLPPVSQPDRH